MKAKKVCAIAQYWTGKEEPLIDEAIAEILAVEDKVVFYTTGDSTIVNYISSILPALKEKFPEKKLSITETSSLGKCDYLIAYYYDLVPDRYNKVLNKVKKFKQSHPETKIFHLYFEDIQDKITEAYNKQVNYPPPTRRANAWLLEVGACD